MNENTQKSNDFQRANFKKELKEKGSRTSELDSAELSPDLNSMGDDLMGSMDPDMFGRSSNAFRRAWEEELEEKPKPPEEEGSEGEGQGEPEDGREEEPAGGVTEPEEPESESESESESEEEAGASVAPERALAPEPDYEQEAAEQPAVRIEPDVLERSQAALDVGEDRLEQASADVLPAEEEPPPADSSFHSLLDQGSGFLRSDLSAETAELAVELLEETLPELSPALSSLTARLISGDRSLPSYRRLEHYLARFGLGVLRAAVNEKVRVLLLAPGEALAAHPLVAGMFAEDPPEGAVYLPQQHTLLLEEACVNRVPRGFNPVLYYFAHAFDHILGDEGYASNKSAAVMASYQSCQQGLAGHRFADDLAGISPMHYFAQAVESYLSEDDCLEPLWTRDDLYDFDRSMYDYVDYLFHRTNKV